MGNPARGRGLPLKMHGLRSYGHGDETAGGEEYQRTQETGWDGSKIKETQIKKTESNCSVGLRTYCADRKKT